MVNYQSMLPMIVYVAFCSWSLLGCPEIGYPKVNQSGHSGKHPLNHHFTINEIIKYDVQIT